MCYTKFKGIEMFHLSKYELQLQVQSSELCVFIEYLKLLFLILKITNIIENENGVSKLTKQLPTN